MAKKYICKVCGYVHTGDKAPAVCPQCQQTNCFEEEKKKGLDTNSNVYTIIYATIVVVIVAVLLAVISQVLSPRQQANKRLDVQKQILTALNVDYSQADPAALYDQYVTEDEWDGKPVYYAAIDGANYTVLPLKGQGLWGGIWGYIALEDDLNRQSPLYRRSQRRQTCRRRPRTSGRLGWCYHHLYRRERHAGQFAQCIR